MNTRWLVSRWIWAASVTGLFASTSFASAQRTFASPEQAAQALRQAAEARDMNAIGDLFGPGYRDLITGNPAEDSKDLERFSKAVAERLVPVADSPDKVTLEIGPRRWPFPIPLVRNNGQWSFDTRAGKDEIIDRRIGRDELHAIGTCRLFAKGKKAAPAQPEYGYVFRKIKEGASSGRALVAYPEKYGTTGIMTFMVGKQGTVFKRDFGEGTAQSASAIDVYRPGPDWTVEDEAGITFKKRR